ncbi:hypothetical protein [Absidia glauca]|uniref:F-box domain-containing protein n=1 Tax=Absidia glauca TaxID=4829 RepID=A0A163MBL9_ABSGL|nr:hypothetical protein [Absidia glauca]
MYEELILQSFMCARRSNSALSPKSKSLPFSGKAIMRSLIPKQTICETVPPLCITTTARYHGSRTQPCGESIFGAVRICHITQLLPLIPLLTELVLSRVFVKDEDMDEVARCCRHLQRITLHSLHFISKETIVSLSRYCSQLTGISLSKCSNITAYALLPLLKTNGLKKLTVGGVPIESEESRFKVGDTSGVPMDTLFWMSMSRLQGPYNVPFIVDWTSLIQSNSSEWALQLTELCLNDIDDETLLMPLLETHTRLESLRLASCRLGTPTLTAIARSLFNLRQLDLSGSRGFSAHNLKTMLKLGCPKLGLLVLTYCQAANKDLAMTVDRLYRADLERWVPDMCLQESNCTPITQA